jgi:hypothetical protein
MIINNTRIHIYSLMEILLLVSLGSPFLLWKKNGLLVYTYILGFVIAEYLFLFFIIHISIFQVVAILRRWRLGCFWKYLLDIFLHHSDYPQ